MQEKVIFINREASVQKGFETSCEQEFAVVFKKDGLEALEWLEREGQASLIIADLYMPHLAIEDFLRTVRLHAALRHIPVIVLSDIAHLTERRKFLELGANDFIVKPVSTPDLKSRIRAVLSKSKFQSVAA